MIKAILSDWEGRVRGKPYRILAIAGEFTLYALAESIVKAFDFDFDHAFGFYDNIKHWIDSRECYELFKDIEEDDWLEPSPCKSVKKSRVNKVFDSIGRLCYLKGELIFSFIYVRKEKDTSTYSTLGCLLGL